MRHISSPMAAALLLFLFLGAPAHAAPDPQQAQAFVQESLNEAFDVLRATGQDKQQKTDRIRGLLREKFNVPTIGKFALGVYRRQTNESQMTAYLDAFEEYLVQVYVDRIVSYTPAQNETASDVLKVTGSRPAGKTDMFVLSVLGRKNAAPEPIEWRVREIGGRLSIIDVSIQGTSQALTYKQDFASVIEKRGNGVDGLIAELREKNTRYRTSENARSN